MIDQSGVPDGPMVTAVYAIVRLILSVGGLKVLWIVGYLVFTAALILLAMVGLIQAWFRKRPPFGPREHAS